MSESLTKKTINIEIVRAFVDSNYKYIEKNLEYLENIWDYTNDCNAVDLLAEIAVLKEDEKLMKYLVFHPRYLIDKYKNSHKQLEFLLKFMKEDLGNDFEEFESYHYYFERVTDRKIFDIYNKYEMNFDSCDVRFIGDPELQDLAIEYGAPDSKITSERFLKFVNIRIKENYKGIEDFDSCLDELIVDEIDNDFESYYEQFEDELSDEIKIKLDNLGLID